MNNYAYNSNIDKTEVEALKELIFRRSKERSEGISSNVNNDVMELARKSLTTNKNPFQIATEIKAEDSDAFIKSNSVDKNQNTNQPQIQPKSEIKTEQADFQKELGLVSKVQKSSNEIGFPSRDLTNIINKNEELNKFVESTEIQKTMIDARNNINNKKSFMGALEFLNSQASIALINKNSNGFNVLA